MVLELIFSKSFGSVLLYIDNTSSLHVTGSRTYSPRAKHIALGYFFVQDLVEGKVSTHYVKTEGRLADLGIKHLSKTRHRDLIKLINESKASNANKVIIFQGEAIIFLRDEYLCIPHIV